MAFNFGSTASKPVFGGQPTTTSASMFGGTTGFNTTTTASSFGFGGTSTFGTAAGGLGGGSTFGSTAGTFGTNTFGTTGGTSFGTNTGFGGGIGTGTTGFGSTLGGGLSSASGFGGGLGTGLNTSAGLSTGFGTGTGFGGGIGTGIGGNTLGGGIGGGMNLASGLQQQNQQVLQEQQKALLVANLATAVSLPVIFGDERDSVLARWNQLQAYWGFGKAFHNQQGACVDLDASNPFCRFKAVGYSVMPKTRNKDGIVGVIFNKKIEDIQTNQMQIVDFLHKASGGKPHISICVESVKPLPEDKTEMLIFVQERSANGATKRLPASDVFNGLSAPQIRNQLASNVAVETIIPKTGLSPEQLKQYLDSPPNGIDPLIWRQAKLDNPDPENLIPVPMIGFKELQKRLKHQEQQTKLHQARLDIVTQDISKLQSKQTDMLAKMEQYKRKHLELSHKVLQVMVRQEIYRKLGHAIQADEETLRVQLEVIQAELNAPTQFKGRLNELMSQLRMQSKLGAGRPDASCHMNSSIQLEIKQCLKQQQEGLQHLMSIIRDDLDDLRLIEQGYTDPPSVHSHMKNIDLIK